jgi:glycosyltransferase involved in cell wall biosynthesis
MRQGIADPRALVRMGRILRRVRPDVVHGHMVHANLLARVARLVAPTPRVISTIHNENEGSQWRYVAYRLTNRLAEVTTTVSRTALAESVRRGAAPAGSIVLVPNGLDVKRYERDDGIRHTTREGLGLGDRFTWLAVGRLAEAKGYPEMIGAFAAVVREHPEATLLIAGEGRLEADVRARIGAAGIADSVRLLGLRSDVAALMQAADGFLMTSRWEGLPMVLLEAGASGLPIVATDVGGSRDVVIDGVSGHLTPAGDPGATAAAIGRVMGMPAADRRSMGEAGREHVRRTFDMAPVADTWEALYRGHGRGAPGVI